MSLASTLVHDLQSLRSNTEDETEACVTLTHASADRPFECARMARQRRKSAERVWRAFAR